MKEVRSLNIYNYTKEQLIDILLEHNFKKYHATQLFEWIYKHKVKQFNKMHNLNKQLVAWLEDNAMVGSLKIKETIPGEDTEKYLIELEDNLFIEAVLMKHKYGLSLCVSSQVGCNMNCTFCASSKLKKQRNLTTGEMTETVVLIENHIKKRISHVVIMGIGEPFDNYDNMMNFIRIINDPHGLAIGSRHITISTCGIIPGIIKLSAEPFQVNLAISLHAANDILRSKLMPINKRYPLPELIKACEDYIRLTNRRITIEYILLKGINDSSKDARELASLIKELKAYVNLIPYNDATGKYKPSNEKNVLIFADILKKLQINVTIRREFGSEINAACGQLRARAEEQK